MKRTSAIANSIVAVAFFISAPAIARQPPQTPNGPDLGLAAPATIGKLDIQPAAFGRLPWVVFDERSGLPQHRSMRSNYARVMQLSKNGGLWVGSFDGGLAYLQDGKWRTWGKRDGLPSDRIRGLLETPDGKTLWIATDHGVATLEGDKIRT